MRKLRSILQICEDLCAYGATSLFVIMMLVVCAEVLLRYGFNSPISWVVEISEYALLWITFLGASWVLRTGGHVRVDIVLQFLSPNGLRLCGMLSSALAAITCAILLAFGCQATWTAYVQGAFKPTGNDVPTWMIIIIIPIGALLLLLRFLRLLVEYYTRQRDFGAEPSH